MAYIEGFVIAVPTAAKDKFIEHARHFDTLFMEHGAARVVEAWGEDVPRGQHTDFYGAVDAKEDETVCFSWIEWPDKAVREREMARMEELMKTDPRYDPVQNPMPFDGKRMIYGGFQPIVDVGTPTPGAYMQGFVVPAYGNRREAYRKMAQDAWPMFQGYGALRMVEAWQDDVPEGKQTDFFRTVKIEPGEQVVFSFIEWPSREVCDAAGAKMQEEMQPPAAEEMPFNGQRMIWAGFSPVVELSAETQGA